MNLAINCQHSIAQILLYAFLNKFCLAAEKKNKKLFSIYNKKKKSQGFIYSCTFWANKVYVVFV